MTLAKHLKQRSKEICEMNECTEDEHNCESYAYINQDYQLLDICAPDYFQGSSKPYAAISLPWDGSQDELEHEVDEQIVDTGDYDEDEEEETLDELMSDEDIKLDHIPDVSECRALLEQMDRDQFWPNVWHINERGNTDLLRVGYNGAVIVKSWV